MCYILSLYVSIMTGRRIGIFEICPARAASQPAYEVANVTDVIKALIEHTLTGCCGGLRLNSGNFSKPRAAESGKG